MQIILSEAIQVGCRGAGMDVSGPRQADHSAGTVVAVLCYVYERRVLHVGHWQLLLPGFLSLDILQNDLTDVTLLPPAYLLLLSIEEVMDDDTPLALGKPHFLSPPFTWDQHGAVIVAECICSTDSSFSPVGCPQA